MVDVKVASWLPGNPAQSPLRKGLLAGDVRQFLLAVCFVSAYLVLIFSLANPRWETNDDVAMSMVAHGYGLAAQASPNIIFSNVLWGHIVQAIPSINGVLGYSIATMVALGLAGTGIFYFCSKLGLGWVGCALLTALVLLRPAIFPQFTLNSGLLTLASALAIASYARTGEARELLLACALGFLGFLIRSQEFLIVLTAALPFLSLRRLYRDKTFLLFSLALATLISSAITLDWLAYSGTEWTTFSELNKARAAYTDFGLANQLKAHPDIASAHGYSINDLDLLRTFFFSDPAILKPKALNGMATELGALPFISTNFPLAYEAIRNLFSNNLLAVSLLALACFTMRPDLKGLAAVLLVMSLAFLMGLVGRGGLERVLAPLIAVLLVFAAVHCGNRLLPFLLSLALAWGLWAVIPQAAASRTEIQLAQDEARKSTDALLFIWGAGMRFESIYPLLANDSRLRQKKIYGLGVFTHAPFSRAYLEEHEGRGLLFRVRSSEGILLIASKDRMDYLRIWCRERYRGALVDETIFSGPVTEIKRVKCE